MKKNIKDLCVSLLRNIILVCDTLNEENTARELKALENGCGPNLLGPTTKGAANKIKS